MIYDKLHLPPPTPAALPPLTTCEIFHVGAQAPSYIGRIAEGNIAPYGILLVEGKDQNLAKRLLDSQVNHQWEYSVGYGPTSADSALVIEGLLAAGVETSVLIESLDRIRDRYYQRESGAFVTVRSGRAEYWKGASSDTTALVAYLMQTLAPKRFRTQIASSIRYILEDQEPAGNWKGKWFPSWVTTTFYAIRFLAVASGENHEAIDRAAAYLLKLQREDGSIGGSVIDTSQAVLSWRIAGIDTKGVAKATQWLEKSVSSGVPAGEVVLYYWFDDPRQDRFFFLCKDQGRIADAWARIAVLTHGPRKGHSS